MRLAHGCEAAPRIGSFRRFGILEGFKGVDFGLKFIDVHAYRVKTNRFRTLHELLVRRSATGFEVGNGAGHFGCGGGFAQAFLKLAL